MRSLNFRLLSVPRVIPLRLTLGLVSFLADGGGRMSLPACLSGFGTFMSSLLIIFSAFKGMTCFPMSLAGAVRKIIDPTSIRVYFLRSKHADLEFRCFFKQKRFPYWDL